MKRFLSTYWKTLLFFALIGLVGGFFVGIYLLDSYPEDIKAQLIAELNASGLGGFPIDILLGVITAMQSVFYGIVLGAIGIWLSKKIGLWRDERAITKNPLIISIIMAVVGGVLMIMPDILFFGQYCEAIANSYINKPTVAYMLATVTYGAVIEEVMLRLFFMSLIAFLLHKISKNQSLTPSNILLIISNIIAAILFAAGHLPATIQMLGASPLIIARCFILNGGLGLIFGWLYRKYGLRYSMIAHGGCHIISKLIWMLFI